MCGSAASASAIATFAAYDFESADGWIVENVYLEDGAWERGVPSGGGIRGDPPTDYDLSGQCFVTGNSPAISDVDGGPTRLVSPPFDLSTAANPTLTYARWFTNDDLDIDRLTVQISSDGGGIWSTIESVESTLGWVERTISIADFTALTSQVRVRFSAIDNPNDSVTEAAVDAFVIAEVLCAAECLKGDVNDDGFIDGADIGGFSDVLVSGGVPGSTAFCAADMDGDGALEVEEDVSAFVVCLVGGACP